MTQQTTQELFESSTGGAPLFFNKNSPVGASVTGTVFESAPVQARDYDDNSLQFWDDGQPKMQLVVTLQTSLRDPAIEEDDGKRRLFIKWWGSEKANLVNAIQRTGDKYLKNGATLSCTFTGLGEQANKKLNPPKLYTFQYVSPPSATEAMMTNGAPAQPQLPIQQPDAVSAARATQVAHQAAQQAPAAPTTPAVNKATMVDQVKALAADGLDAPTIEAIVGPGLSRNAITAIINLVK